MNAAEIRELAIERVYQTLAAPYDVSATKPSSYHDADDRSMMHGAMRVLAEQIVDGLGDLLPTSASYGAATEPIGKRWLAERADEPAARYLATRANAIPVRRYVGDWHELGDVNGEVHAILDLDLVRVTPEAEQ